MLYVGCAMIGNHMDGEIRKQRECRPYSFVLNLVFSLVLQNLLLQDKQKIFMAKYYCVRLHTLFGAALAAGLVVSRMVTKGYVPRLIFS